MTLEVVCRFCDEMGARPVSLFSLLLFGCWVRTPGLGVAEPARASAHPRAHRQSNQQEKAACSVQK